MYDDEEEKIVFSVAKSVCLQLLAKTAPEVLGRLGIVQHSPSFHFNAISMLNLVCHII